MILVEVHDQAAVPVGGAPSAIVLYLIDVPHAQPKLPARQRFDGVGRGDDGQGD